MSSTSAAPSTSSPKTLLALIPGLVAVFGLFDGDLSTATMLGCALLLLFVGAAWIQNGRQVNPVTRRVRALLNALTYATSLDTVRWESAKMRICTSNPGVRLSRVGAFKSERTLR